MKTLSYKQPWAWLVAVGIKPIENRTWKLPDRYIGQRVLIHASGKREVEESNNHNLHPLDCLSLQQKIELGDKYYTGRNGIDRFELYNISSIIGSIEIVDCVLNHSSIWAQHWVKKWKKNGEFIDEVEIPIYNWILANPILFPEPILNVKGKLGFWDYDLLPEYQEQEKNNPVSQPW